MSEWGVINGPPLRSILDSTKRINIWHGPVSSSKTVHSLIRWIEYVLTAPSGALLMIGKTEDTLERNILAPLEEATGGAVTYSKGKHRAYVKDREIILVGANDERAEQKIRGMTAAGAYGDEITLWPESFFKQLLARLRVPGAQLFGTTNPDGPYHWLKAGYLDREGELNLRGFTWPLEVNTYLTREYVENLKAEYAPGTLWYRRFIEGQWVAAEGAVYDFWDEKAHTVSEAGEPDELYLAMDYGTSNATSAGLYGIYRGKTPQVVRLRGYYHSGRDTGRSKTDSDYADDLDEAFGDVKARVKAIILDPSAASFKTELRKPARGWNVRDAVNDVVDGIRTQARLLKTGKYKILAVESNQQCIRDYGAYLWDAKAQAKGEDKPLKQFDHTKDEERYLLHTLFGRPSTTPVSKPSGW